MLGDRSPQKENLGKAVQAYVERRMSIQAAAPSFKMKKLFFQPFHHTAPMDSNP